MSKIPDNTAPRIVIVDDEPQILESLQSMLQDNGYEVSAFTDSRRLFQTGSPVTADLFVLDINIPYMDGLECCRRLQKRKETAHIPVIFITGYNDETNKDKAFAAGGVDFINKPFTFSEVLHRIHTHVKLYKLRREAEASRREAEEAKQAQSRFLANISHELRTPLNALIGLNSLLSDTDLDSRQADYIAKIEQSTQYLLTIVSDFLDISKFNSGKIKLEKTDFFINDILRNIRDMIQFKTASKNLEVLYSIDRNIPALLKGDPYRLEQILLNLVSNAVKFTEKGEIVISVKLAEMQESHIVVEFRVKDSGIGMTQSQQQQIFKPFTQADAATTRFYGGTGLGLTICKQLTELMGGTIGVSSRPGNGSVFYFTACFALSEQSSRTSLLQCPADIKNLRVMVVDDNASARLIFKQYLENFSLRVKTVNSGKEAISEFLMANGEKKDPYHLVLMDYKLPDLNGVETFKQIRKLKRLPQPRIVMVSASSRKEIKYKVDAAGMDGFLMKPVVSSMLYDTIVQLMSKQPAAVRKKKKQQNSGKLVEKVRDSHVMVVEDNEINRSIINEMLTQQGLKVTLAHNGRECLQQLKQAGSHVDLIFMDLHMPKMNGYETVKAIRADKSLKSIPVLALTAEAESEIKDKIKSNRFNGYISKPFTQAELLRKTARIITDKQKNRNNKSGKKNRQSGKPASMFKEADNTNALQPFMGNKKQLYKLLKLFYNNNKNIAANGWQLLQNNNTQNLFAAIHKLKGAAGNLALNSFYQSAVKITGELKKEKPDKESISRELHYLDTLFKQLAQELNLRRDENTAATDRPAADKPDSDRVLFCLQTLRNKLAAFSPDAAAELQKLRATLPDSAYSKEMRDMEKQLSEYNFTRAEETAAILAQKLQHLQ
ncbi:MAG TPA: response regulator [Spirochaetota bacterium]|nr:response regulator [Spirochaetota bacterium]